jgi:hypothetical protein
MIAGKKEIGDIAMRTIGAHMAYFIGLFSPETYEAFAPSSGDISGFRLRPRSTA